MNVNVKLKILISWAWFTALIVTVYPEDCTNYVTINDDRRSTENVYDDEVDYPLCDRGIDTSRWYRFSSYIGDRIPERNIPDEFVAINRCGTQAPMFIKGKGSHPDADGVTFQALVCANFGQGGTNCHWEGSIKIFKCPAVDTESSFYVYQLAEPPGCSLAYCAGEETPCEPGLMWDGTACVAHFPPLAGNPILSGPHTSGSGTGKQVEFFCEIPYNHTENDAYANVKVTFLFNGDPMEVISGPFETLGPYYFQPEHGPMKAVLKEEHLRGRLGKEIRCQAVSYWDESSDIESGPRVSDTGYLAGIWSSSSSYEFDISTGSVFTIEYVPTLPLTCSHCQHYQNCKCMYEFRKSNDGSGDIAAQCSVKWISDNDPPVMQLYVVPYDLGAGSLQFQLNFLPYDDDFVLYSSSSLWHGYTVANTSIRIYDGLQQTTYLQCRSDGDPRFLSFDGYKFDSYMVGDFVLVSAINPETGHHMEVQVRQEICNSDLASCTCGVIVRERNSAYKVSLCNSGEWQMESQRTMTAVQLLAQSPHDRSQLFIDGTGTKFSIRMPSGLRVEIDGTMPWFNIVVHLPPEYHGKTTQYSLCGNSNYNQYDDVLNPENFRIPTTTQNYFAEQPECTDLFYPAAMTCSCYNFTAVKCTNADPTAVQVSPATTHLEQLSITGVVCYPPNNSSENSSTENPGTFSMESPNFTADEIDPDLILDPGEIYSSPEFDLDFGKNVSFSWPTPEGKTEAQVEEYCRNTLSSSPAYSECSAIGDVETLVDFCKSDVQIADEYINMNGYTTGMEQKCVNTLAAENNTEVLESVSNKVCPNHCNDQGTCINATCSCYQGFMGVDCSIDSSKPPTLSGIARHGLCDAQAKPCNSISVYGSNIASGSKLKCRFQDPTGGVVETLGALLSSSEVKCSLDGSSYRVRRKRSAKEIMAVSPKQISLTNDGILYSNQVEFLIYDSKCMSCGEDHACFHKNNSCLINERCYANGEVRGGDTCEQCIPNESSVSWIDKSVIEEWSACSRTCDYGAHYQNTVCKIDSSIMSSENQLCLESTCPVIPEENSEGVIIEVTTDDLTMILLDPSSISDEIAKAVNGYCSNHTTECCNSVGVPDGSTLNEFTSSKFCPIGSGYPIVANVSSLKMIVKINASDVQQQCAETASKAGGVIYADPEIIYEAVLESKEDIEDALNVEIVSVIKVERVIYTAETTAETSTTPHPVVTTSTPDSQPTYSPPEACTSSRAVYMQFEPSGAKVGGGQRSLVIRRGGPDCIIVCGNQCHGSIIADCSTNPCKNGATCVQQSSGYSCECAPGFNGTNCDDECSGVTCAPREKLHGA